MTKETALRLLDELDARVAWSQAEYAQGVKEAEDEGEEPMANPHAFDVRLDASDRVKDFERDYKVRVVPTDWTHRGDFRAIFELAEQVDCSLVIQNRGIELS